MKPTWQSPCGTLSLIKGDCLEAMPRLVPFVDCILSDLPYGTTACKWDTVIPFAPLWENYRRLIKRNGAIVLTASQPFTSALVMSNLDWFKYSLVWEKSIGAGFLNAKNKPLRFHEDVLVFSGGTTANCSPRRMSYNPQPYKGNPYKTSKTATVDKRTGVYAAGNRKPFIGHVTTENGGTQYPRSILRFRSVRGATPPKSPSP